MSDSLTPDTPGRSAYDDEDDKAVTQARAVARMLASAIRDIPCDPIAPVRGALAPDHKATLP